MEIKRDIAKKRQVDGKYLRGRQRSIMIDTIREGTITIDGQEIEATNITITTEDTTSDSANLADYFNMDRETMEFLYPPHRNTPPFEFDNTPNDAGLSSINYCHVEEEGQLIQNKRGQAITRLGQLEAGDDIHVYIGWAYADAVVKSLSTKKKKGIIIYDKEKYFIIFKKGIGWVTEEPIQSSITTSTTTTTEANNNYLEYYTNETVDAVVNL